MTDLNHVSIGGRLTRDTKLEKNDTTSFVRATLAVNRSVYNKETGKSTDKPAFVNFCLFGKYAEAMEKHLKKGVYVTLEGHLEMDTWSDTDGKNHQELKVVPDVGKVNPWVGGKKDSSDNSGSSASEELSSFPADEDLPFDIM